MAVYGHDRVSSINLGDQLDNFLDAQGVVGLKFLIRPSFGDQKGYSRIICSHRFYNDLDFIVGLVLI